MGKRKHINSEEFVEEAIKNIRDDRAMAVKVDVKREDTKGFPHVTVAINPDGGKPFHSNQIKDFEKYSGKLSGVVKEIPNR